MSERCTALNSTGTPTGKYAGLACTQQQINWHHNQIHLTQLGETSKQADKQRNNNCFKTVCLTTNSYATTKEENNTFPGIGFPLSLSVFVPFPYKYSGKFNPFTYQQDTSEYHNQVLNGYIL